MPDLTTNGPLALLTMAAILANLKGQPREASQRSALTYEGFQVSPSFFFFSPSFFFLLSFFDRDQQAEAGLELT